MTHGTRLRLTAGYALVWLAMVTALCGVAYVAMARSLDREVDAGIRSVVDTWLASAPPLERLQTVNVEREFEGQTAGVFLLVFGSDGSLLGNPNRVHVDDLFEHADLAGVLQRGGWATIAVEGQSLRVLATPVVREGSRGGIVVGGRSLAEHDRQQALLAVVLIIASGVGLVVAIAGGYVLAGRALRPLELAYERQRAFIGDASHELRSPLAVIRTATDLLLRGEMAPAQRQVIEELREVADETATLVQDLLVLARLDRPGAMPGGSAQLDEAAAVVLGQLRPLLEQHGLRIETRLALARARVGDVEARRMVRALLENIVMHTPERSSVEVETGVRDRQAWIAVRDRGPGIPETALERVFERFGQVEEARTPRALRGAGLGLAIVRAIARSAGGDAVARNRPGGGLEVEVILPLASS